MRVLCFLIFSMFISTPSVQENEQQYLFNPCLSSNTAFDIGEKLTYRLYYNWGLIWLSAGEVEFTVDEEGENYHFKAYGNTYPSYEWFYKVRDRYESVADKQSLVPSWSLKDIDENGYTRYDELNFKQGDGKIVSLRGETIENRKETIFEVNECMHDVLSILYHTRTLEVADIKQGEEVPISFFLDGETYDINMKYRGDKNSMKIKGLGKFDVHHFTPELIGGDIFQEGTEMSIFVSNDMNKIPLLIESPLQVGTVKAVLKSHSGLRNPLDAKR